MTFVHCDKLGNQTEYSDSSENDVIVKLKEPYYSFPIQYQIGDEIVLPIEVAQRIKCEIKGNYMENKNCDTCKNNSMLNRCILNEKSGMCAKMNFMYYENDETKKLLKCERCDTYSVREYVGGQMSNLPNLHISLWCLKCDDYPIVDGKILSKKENDYDNIR